MGVYESERQKCDGHNVYKKFVTNHHSRWWSEKNRIGEIDRKGDTTYKNR